MGGAINTKCSVRCDQAWYSVLFFRRIPRAAGHRRPTRRYDKVRYIGWHSLPKLMRLSHPFGVPIMPATNRACADVLFCGHAEGMILRLQFSYSVLVVSQPRGTINSLQQQRNTQERGHTLEQEKQAWDLIMHGSEFFFRTFRSYREPPANLLDRQQRGQHTLDTKEQHGGGWGKDREHTRAPAERERIITQTTPEGDEHRPNNSTTLPLRNFEKLRFERPKNRTLSLLAAAAPQQLGYKIPTRQRPSPKVSIHDLLAT